MALEEMLTQLSSEGVPHSGEGEGSADPADCATGGLEDARPVDGRDSPRHAEEPEQKADDAHGRRPRLLPFLVQLRPMVGVHLLASAAGEVSK